MHLRYSRTVFWLFVVNTLALASSHSPDEDAADRIKESSNSSLGIPEDHPPFNPRIQFAKRAKSETQIAPLDVNDNLNHSVELVTSLVGIIGSSVGSLLYALTGISLTDCALSFKDVDVDHLSCEDFLDILSECESLQHIKPLLKSSKIKYRKAKGRAASSQRPCSRNRH